MTIVLRQVSKASEGIEIEQELFDSSSTYALIWVTTNDAIVCPRSFQNRSGFREVCTYSSDSGWPVVLRPSGGGAVPLGPGVINFSLMFTVDANFSIDEGYKLITRIIRNSLPSNGKHLHTGRIPGSFCDGKWNLSLNGRKVVGAAQRRRPVGGKRYRVQVHALILSHGEITSGTEAVSWFNCRLGLDPIKEEFHTVLENFFGNLVPDQVTIAEALLLTANHHINALVDMNWKGFKSKLVTTNTVQFP